MYHKSDEAFMHVHSLSIDFPHFIILFEVNTKGVMMLCGEMPSTTTCYRVPATELPPMDVCLQWSLIRCLIKLMQTVSRFITFLFAK